MRLTRPFGLPDGRVGGAPPPVAFVRPRASLGPVSLAPRSSSDHVSWSDVVVVNEGNGMVRCRGRASARRVTAKKGTETAVKVARIRPCGCRPCPACNLPDGHMRGREIPGPGPILSRFCSDLVLSRDNPSNSGSQGPLRDHTYHITNTVRTTTSISTSTGCLRAARALGSAPGPAARPQRRPRASARSCEGSRSTVTARHCRRQNQARSSPASGGKRVETKTLCLWMRNRGPRH